MPTRGQTRIITRSGTNYIVSETLPEVAAMFERIGPKDDAFLQLTITPAQTAFPPTEFFVRANDVASMQAVSHEAWVWQQQADENYYAQALAASPSVAESQAELVKWLKEQTGGEESL